MTTINNKIIDMGNYGCFSIKESPQQEMLKEYYRQGIISIIF